MKYTKFILAITLLSISMPLWAQSFNIGIIPTPQHVELTHQGYFLADKNSCTIREIKASEVNGTPIHPSRSIQQMMNRKKNTLIPIWSVTVDSIQGALNQSQAYRIDIMPQQIILTSTSEQGELYAQSTLRKLFRRHLDSLPCMTIIDYPAYAFRIWQDDISRGPVSNQKFATDFSNIMSHLFFNGSSFYTEHTLFNPAYPDLCSPTNNLPFQTPCSPKVANLQCFGHFEETLRNPYYWHLQDSPTNLDPSNKKSYQLLQQQINNTKQRYQNEKHYFFNINCDETEALGSGRASLYVNANGANNVYCQHINRVYKMAKTDSNDIMMWGDIVSKHPEMIAQLPSDMILIAWNYSPSTDFSSFLRPYVEAKQKYGNPFWVAPGTCHYSSIQARTENYMPNIAYLARDGYRYGASGILTTTWDDSGLDLISDSYHALAWAAEMSWNPIKSTDPKQAAAEYQQREAQFNDNYNYLVEQWESAIGFEDDAFYGCEDLYLSTPFNSTLYDGESFSQAAAQEAEKILLEELIKSSNLVRIKQSLDSHEEIIKQIIGENFPTLRGYDLTDFIYEVSHLLGHPLVGDWYRTEALDKPLLDFYPSTIGSQARQRADSVLLMIEDICYRYHIPTLEQQSQRPHLVYAMFNEAPMAHGTYIYALHRLEATARKAQLRCDLYQVYNNHDVNQANHCRKAMDQLVQLCHTLESEYLGLWDLENGEYSRNLVIDRYNRLAADILEADRHVFVTQTVTQPQPQPKGKKQTKSEPCVTINLNTLFDWHPNNNYPIYYTLDGRKPSKGSTLYRGPFTVDRSCEIKTLSFDQWNEPVYQSHFTLFHKGLGHPCTLHTPYSTYREMYSGGGDQALLDGQLGSDNNYADGHWQGYWGENIDVTLDWGTPQEVNSITMRFFQHTFDWILAPETILIYYSSDGQQWQLGMEMPCNPDPRKTDPHIETYTLSLDANPILSRYIRIKVLNGGPLPEFHGAHGQPSYLFTDEIVIE